MSYGTPLATAFGGNSTGAPAGQGMQFQHTPPIPSSLGLRLNGGITPTTPMPHGNLDMTSILQQYMQNWFPFLGFGQGGNTRNTLPIARQPIGGGGGTRSTLPVARNPMDLGTGGPEAAPHIIGLGQGSVPGPVPLPGNLGAMFSSMAAVNPSPSPFGPNSPLNSIFQSLPGILAAMGMNFAGPFGGFSMGTPQSSAPSTGNQSPAAGNMANIMQFLQELRGMAPGMNMGGRRAL